MTVPHFGRRKDKREEIESNLRSSTVRLILEKRWNLLYWNSCKQRRKEISLTQINNSSIGTFLLETKRWSDSWKRLDAKVNHFCQPRSAWKSDRRTCREIFERLAKLAKSIDRNRTILCNKRRERATKNTREIHCDSPCSTLLFLCWSPADEMFPSSTRRYDQIDFREDFSSDSKSTILDEHFSIFQR